MYEWNAGNPGACAHACAGDNLVCVHMINSSPLVLWTFDVPRSDRSPKRSAFSRPHSKDVSCVPIARSVFLVRKK